MRFALLGLEIAVGGNAGPEVAAALAPLARAGAPGGGAPAVVLDAERSTTPRPVPEPAVFVHHPLRAGWQEGRLAVGDGSSLFLISPDGRRIEARLTADALADGGRALTALHLPVVLAFALRHHGVFHLHAAALEDGARTVLVAGQSGVGKTTLALALLEAGLGCLSDDAVFVRELEREAWVEGMLRPFHLRPATLGAFPAAAAHAGPADASGRRDLDVGRAWPDRARAGPRRPGLLVFPELRGGATAVARLSPADALGRLVEASALVVVDGAARTSEHLALLGRIASGAPALRVELGEDLLRTPAAVARRILAAGA